jgi:hypothetical protein
MSKRTAGVVVGLAVASVAALATPISTAMASGTTSLAAATVRIGASTVLHSMGSAPVAKTGAAVKVTTSAVAAKPATKVAAAVKVASTVAVKPKPKPKPAPKPPVYRLVRKVLLQLPTTALVGSNVSGFVQVLDDNGQVQSPVANVRVQFQRKDYGRWTVLSDDVTDENGVLPVAFMSQTNVTVRAVYVPVKGAPVAGKALNVTSASQVTWAARPDMEVAAKAQVSYLFRVNAGFVPTGHLEFVLASKSGGRWATAPSARVDSTGVVKAKVAFPGPGTYLLRGTTGKSPTNAAGFTSTITVVVD